MIKRLGATLLILMAMLSALLPTAQVLAVSETYYSSASDGYEYMYDLGSGTSVWTGVHDNSQAYEDGWDTTNTATVAIESQRSGTDYDATVERAFLYFNTAAIPDSATITGATLSLYVTNVVADLGAFDVIIQKGTSTTYPHDPMIITDYNTIRYTGDCGQLNSASMTTGQYNDWTLTATGYGWISKTGTTKFAVREENHDEDNVTPTFTNGIQYWNQIDFYTQEKGTTYRPKLVVTYTMPNPPTVSMTAATSVTDDAARLNCTITSDGGDAGHVQVRWGYGKTSQTAANFASYTTVSSWAGTYSTDSTPYEDISTLDAGSVYYARVQAKNGEGSSVTSDEISFTTQSAPDITADEASNVAKYSARLNGTIDDDGEDTVEVSWGYGTTSQAAVDFASYDTVTAFAGAYETGQHPYLDVASLTDNETYYYRFQGKNSIGTVTSSAEITFDTQSAVGDPSNLIALPESTEIKLAWVKGDGSTNTMVRYSNVAFPTTQAEGSLVYLGTGVLYTHTGLTSGTTYYYSAFGVSGGDYSTGYATAMVTTDAGTATTPDSTIQQPARWFEAPDYTNLQNLTIIYDPVNAVADDLEIPRASFWMLCSLALTAIGGTVSYYSAKEAMVGAGVGLLLITLSWTLEIAPFYLVVIFAILVFATIRAKKEMD